MYQHLEEQEHQNRSVQNKDDSNDEAKDSEDEADLDRYWPPPISERIELASSYKSKTVSALAINNAGTRLCAGGSDHELRIWDFEAMDRHQTWPIANTQPCGGFVMKSLDYSIDDELILAISESCQATIVAKDGLVSKNYQCPKGDQYLRDMTHTKGHVQVINDGCWNPRQKDLFITCSNDGTVRIWDLKKLTQQLTVIKARSPGSGLRASPTICRYTRDSLTLASGCNDGNILMWDTRRKFISTSMVIRGAHQKGMEISGLDFSHNLEKIVTRGEDESCKIWDMRLLKSPVAVRSGLESSYPGIDCSFSPDDRFVITGTSSTKDLAGSVKYLNSNDLEILDSMEMGPGVSVLRCRWHEKINHVVCSCSNGTVVVAFDETRSLGGFVSGISSSGTRKRKRLAQQKPDESDLKLLATGAKRIITPHALPLFRDEPVSGSSSFAKLRQDPKRSYKPEMGPSGTSEGGRIKPAGSTLSSYVARAIARPKVDPDQLDIRQRILRHAEDAAREPQWFKPAPGQQAVGAASAGAGSASSAGTQSVAPIAAGADPPPEQSSESAKAAHPDPADHATTD